MRPGQRPAELLKRARPCDPVLSGSSWLAQLLIVCNVPAAPASQSASCGTKQYLRTFRRRGGFVSTGDPNEIENSASLGCRCIDGRSCRSGNGVNGPGAGFPNRKRRGQRCRPRYTGEADDDGPAGQSRGTCPSGPAVYRQVHQARSDQRREEGAVEAGAASCSQPRVASRKRGRRCRTRHRNAETAENGSARQSGCTCPSLNLRRGLSHEGAGLILVTSLVCKICRIAPSSSPAQTPQFYRSTTHGLPAAEPVLRASHRDDDGVFGMIAGGRPCRCSQNRNR